MAEILLSVVTEGIISKVLSLTSEAITLAWGFKEDLEMMGNKLKMIQALLSDAERKQIQMSCVQLWLRTLNAAASDADDLLEEISYEFLRRKVEIQDRISKKVLDFLSPSHNKLAFRNKMARKIKNVNLLFDKIYHESFVIGLRAVELINTAVELRSELRLPQTHPYVDDSEVVGRDADVSKILDMLINSYNEKDPSVIAIVGMPGQGKTTLAQLVYRQDNVVKHFDCRIWVCVSHDFDFTRLLKEILESLTGTSCNMSNMEAIIRKIQESVSGKRFLLVLDDVWNENESKWYSMRNSLLGIGGSKGSKILVTTRSNVVASTMQTSAAHGLKGLSNGDDWTLFKRRAFAEGGPKETPNLVAIGKRILKRCGGVPLAIKSLGGLMYSKMYENEWLSIENSEIWDTTEDGNGVLATLRLSYDHLPFASLKKCFSYCSVLSKDSVIIKNKLIQLWMAQGFLLPSKGSHLMMEDIGNSYFNVLLWNNLLQGAELDEDDNITSYKIHDLVHDFAVHTSKNYCLILDDSEVNDISDVQHLSWMSTKKHMPKVLEGKVRRLRTLFSSGDVLGNKAMNFKCLRALVLTAMDIGKLPSSVSKLKHLRYLDISRTNIRQLPDSITKLYNLQTLRLSDCYHMKELPRNFENLINLRHFYMRDTDMSCLFIGIGKLTCLQTLPFFVVNRDKGCQIEELGTLSNLKGELKILGLEDVINMEEAKKANLSMKSNIHTLGFHWGEITKQEDCNYEEVLEGLKPHSNLKGLTIANFEGERFASWMRMASPTSLLNNLVKIKLVNCSRCKEIPTLGQLRTLECVEIEGMQNVERIGSEFYGHVNGIDGGRASAITVFPSLKKLRLSSMGNLVVWLEVSSPQASAGMVFPNLENLEIRDCPGLITAPSHFPSMKSLTIIEINSLALAQISSKLTSLTSLFVRDVSGSEISSILEQLLRNNRLIRKLDIEDCNELRNFPNGLNNLVALERLSVRRCNNITSMADIITGGSSFTSLKVFIIAECEKLTCLPNSLQNLVSLVSLWVADCPNVIAIPDIHCLPSLRILDISRCEKLMGLPCGLQVCTSLSCLTIQSCPALISVPNLSELKNFSLRSLTLVDCGMTCWPEWLHLLTSVEDLGIGGFCQELDFFPWPTNDTQHLLVSLECLQLYGWPKLEFLPKQLQQLTNLNHLELWQFDGLESLPDWLGNLSSLNSLWLYKCKKLTNLPGVEAMCRLTKLHIFEIIDCPLLTERCTKGSGAEWPKVSQIPEINIDRKPIQSQR